MNSITPNPSESQDNKPLDWRHLDLSKSENLRALDQRIAELLEAIPLTFIPVEDDILIYRTGLDELDGTPWDAVGHFTTNVNCALQLATEYAFHFSLSFSPDRMNWRAEFSLETLSNFADARDPAIAICIAWLKWNDPVFGGES